MFDLPTIKKLNDRACKVKVEDNHNRQCSWTGSIADGIVLHSAKFRNTVFLSPPKAAIFVKRAHRKCADVNHLIESYFV